MRFWPRVAFAIALLLPEAALCQVAQPHCCTALAQTFTYDGMVESIDNPTLYYPLSDATPGAVDTQAGLTLPAVGSPVTGTSSLLPGDPSSTSTTFSGSGNYYKSANIIEYPQTDDAFTFEAWVKYPSLPVSHLSVIYAEDYQESNGYLLYLDTSSNLHLDLLDDGGNYTVATLTAGTVYYMTLVQRYGTTTYNINYLGANQPYFWQFYINGVSVAHGTDFPGTIEPADTSIGGSIDNACCGLIMQKVGLYFSKALALSRIQAHYTCGTTGVCH